MRILFTIAARNLREHKTKTLIIGVIIAMGMFVLVIGNSLLDSASRGIESNFTANYTGDLIVAGSALENPGLTVDSIAQQEEPVPRLPDFPALEELVRSTPGVAEVVPVVSGLASLQFDEDGQGFMSFYGVEPESYRSFFPDSLRMLEGRFLEPGEEGIVLSDTARDQLEETAGLPVEIGSEVLATSVNEFTGTKIRALPVVGIFEFVNVSGALELMSYVDIENARVLTGLTRITDLEADLTDEQRAGLGSVDEGALFGSSDDGLFGDAAPADDEGALLGSEEDLFGDVVVSTVETAPVAISEDSLLGILGDSSLRDELTAVDPLAWHYLLVRTEGDGAGAAARVRRTLDERFSEAEVPVATFDWIQGAGITAQLTNGLRIVFNGLIIVVAVVAVVIIMNTLVISVTERVAEIGTMRAIGAQKIFVRRMVLLETLMIAILFGGIGVALGSIAVAIMGIVGIEAPNEFIEVLIGGPTLDPRVSVPSVAWSMVAIALAGLIASFYPVALALKIRPVTAMSSNT